MDTLKKIFGGCHRCIKYYFENDKNPIAFENPITKSFDHINFEAARKKEEELPDIDELKRIVIYNRGITFG